jgi:hypothetical protein
MILQTLLVARPRAFSYLTTKLDVVDEPLSPVEAFHARMAVEAEQQAVEHIELLRERREPRCTSRRRTLM